MPHASNIVQCDGPDSPHAFDSVPVQPRRGTLDTICPVCEGRRSGELPLQAYRLR